MHTTKDYNQLPIVLVALPTPNKETTESEGAGLIFLPFFPDFLSKFGRPRNCLLEISEFLGFGETPRTILGDETRPKLSIFTSQKLPH